MRRSNRTGTDKRALWATAAFQARTAADRTTYRATQRAFLADLAAARAAGGVDAYVALRNRQSSYLAAMEQDGNRSASFPPFAEWEKANRTAPGDG